MVFTSTYKKVKDWKLLSLLAMLLLQVGISRGQVYTFSTAGATGINGPTQLQVDNAYASTTLANNVTVTAGIQNWSVPVAGLYKIEVYGAKGYGVYGGKGAYMSGEFSLNASDVLKILVGQQGGCCNGAGTNQYGGGGGTFVATSTNTPLIVAGGGGGAATFYSNVNLASSHNTVADASITTTGKTASGTTNGAGGTAGNGGSQGNTGGGGGGFLTNANSAQGGLSFLNGGTGGNGATGLGGFGGGGGITGQNNMRAGGGGGYSGGGGCGSSTTVVQIGGGGGSFNSGANQVNTPALGTGDGQVVITLLAPAVSAPNNAGTTGLPSLSGNFCPGSQNVTVRVRNFGNNFIDSVKIGWSVNGIIQNDVFHKVKINTYPTVPYDTLITVGSYNFVSGLQVVKVWTSLPNNQADPSTNNDTITVSITPSMTGVYTINSAVATGGTNYQTFTAFVNSLVQNGICGPVTANVAAGSGPYNEQINIPQINGASSTNTITINGNGRTITMSTPSASNYATINLDGADYITINNLNIEALHASTGFGVHLMNSANNNNFKRCTILANPTATATTSGGVSMSGSAIAYTTAGNNGNNNSFDSCTVSGGYFGFFFYAATTGDSMNNVTNCNILDNYVYSTYHYYHRSSVVSNNIIDRSTRATVSTAYGPLLTTGCENNTIESNIVRNMFPGTNTGTGYLLYCASDGTAGRENKIINNLVYNIGGNGDLYGIYLSGADYVQCYNNTVVLDNASSTGGVAYGIYATGTVGGIDIKNNNVYITRGGSGTKYCLYYTGAGAKSSNYNNLYINAPAGINGIGYDGTARVSFNDWQTMGTGAGSPFDANSQNSDPMFANASGGNFIPTNAMLDNLGTPIAIVATDITGTARNAATPDIGAYEFSVPPCLGTPSTAGIASKNLDSTCVGGPVQLTLSGFPIAAGINIQWEESYGSNVWNPIPGATTPGYTVTFAGPVSYRAAVNCNFGTPAYSNVLNVTQLAAIACYCSPKTGTTLHTNTGNYITKVEIAGTSLNNTTTGAGAGGYTGHYPTAPSTTAALTQIVNYNLNVTLGASSYTAIAWIDYDHSGTFDVGEETVLTNAGSTATGILNIPTTSLTGVTGLRIRAASNATTYTNADACLSVATGYETEDYIINISANVPCTGTPSSAGTATISRDTLCVIGDISLKNVNYPQQLGIVMNWQSSPAGANTFTDIGGANLDTFSVFGVSASTDYRLRVTCSSVGGGTAYSNIVKVVVNNPTLSMTVAGSRCGTGPVALYAAAANGAKVNWYTAPTGGVPLATGNIFVTPSISTTTPYYAAASSGGGNTGPELMYYKFDVPGTTVMNEATNPVGNNPATVTGLTIGGTGQFGTGLQGAAGATATNRVDPGWTGTHTGSWTISFWMNVPTPPTTRYMFGNSTGNGTFRCFIGGAAQGIRLTGGVPSITLDMPSWTSGTHVITYVYDQGAGTVSGYIDGIFQGTQTPGVSYPLVGANFVVGSQGTSIDGTMDEFRMYSRALTAAEVAASWSVSVGGCEGVRTQVDATINPAGTGNLATGGTVVGNNQADGTTVNYDAPCADKVVSVQDAPGGNVLGNTSATVIVSPTVQTYNTKPYVARVHDITPASSGAATVTIYALQSEFNAYNSYVTSNSLSLPLLPTSASDPNASNIVVTQWHGSASAASAGPGG
ncbi:MAG TPA: LamG-like jellyroll fold domain-containing protein, partial [Flavipsychrobacter sp.]|nr:LamG-like jellyroll fold domain-containing protein [Flavipsychrobacter sp.]